MLHGRGSTGLLPAEDELIEDDGVQAQHFDESHLEGTVRTLTVPLQTSPFLSFAPAVHNSDITQPQIHPPTHPPPIHLPPPLLSLNKIIR